MGYNIFGWLLKKYPITFISLGGISVPLFVHLYGPFILGEPLSLSFFGALALVALGTTLFVRSTKKKEKAPSAT
jgi:drug/metabolite transporter (DMT)-like permease